MKSKKVAHRGFDFEPEGRLLQQVLEFSGSTGIAYERSVHFSKVFHRHDRPILVCPRGGCRMSVEIRNSGEKFQLNSNQILWVPKDLEHNDIGLSAIYDTLALLPSSDLLSTLNAETSISAKTKHRLTTSPILCRRSKWLDDVLHQYFRERIIHSRHTGARLDFLASEVLREFFKILEPEVNFLDRPSNDVDGSSASQAIDYIESNLFENMSVNKIAQYLNVSISTLQREFKKQIKLTPYNYIKQRRLDEAYRLLESKEYAVGDVALLVGYDDFSAFSKAFRIRFGKSPSELVE